MKHYSKKEFDILDSRYRAHFINSVTGYKSANLLGTKSPDGTTNLAVFSSVTHLGSNPPLLGFVLRPRTVSRNTYDNLRRTGFFTVNHVNSDIIIPAHKTSAKYDSGISEFSRTGLTEEFLDGFEAPYVKESVIKIGCSYQNEYYIKENECLLIVGLMQHIYVDEGVQNEDGWLDLEKAKTVTVNGLDGYALPKTLDRLSYAKPGEEVNSIIK